MFKIINKLILGQDIKRLDIEAPHIADSFHPGQFVMMCADENQKWLPLSIVEASAKRGIISVIFKEVGPATQFLGSLPIGDEIFSITGPFGHIKEPRQFGVVVCMATGVSVAQILPICRAYSRAGNKVIGILGAKTKTELILEPQMRIACHKIFRTTEDGSDQRRGKAEDLLKEVFTKEDVSLVYSVGDVAMMKNAAAIAKQHGVPSLIQVSTVMSCGRGICGSCRVKVNERIALACEEGPEFDGHVMDFDYLQQRMAQACCQSENAKADGEDTKLGFFKKLFQTE